MPSVITLIEVLWLTLSVNLTLNPTTSPKGVLISSAILVATDLAAILLGWVWPIIFLRPLPSAKQILGSWVVFPEPVSPQRIVT